VARKTLQQTVTKFGPPALAAVGALALAACGGGGVSPESVAKAATKTAAVKSYRVEATTKLKLNGKSVTFVAKGVFDPKARRGRMTLDMSDLGLVQGGGDSPYNYGYATFILNGKDMYMRIPLLRLNYRSLKPWVKIDLEQAGKAAGLDSYLRFGAGGDPTQLLTSLRGLGKLDKKGTETVRGVSTTHYKGTIDLKKVQGGEQLTQIAGTSKLPVDVWVDENGFVRRQKWTEKLSGEGGEQTDVEIAMDLYDFGAPVVALVPPPRDVTDFTQGGSES
jgi:hypothetical protein